MWLWVVFHVFVLLLLSLDLGISKKKEIKPMTALSLSAGWIGLALLFNGFVYWHFGASAAIEFFTAYLVEKSLSIDNIFIFMVIFSTFHVPKALQYRVLYLGVLTAFVLRLGMILAGVSLIVLFHWLIYVLGVVVGITGLKLVFQKKEKLAVGRNWLVKFVHRRFNVTEEYVGDKFMVWRKGIRYLTPLFIVLLMVESTDVIFALDSIPAVLAVTQDSFIAYTSNVFAVLGLRALYFFIAPWIDIFSHFKKGLGVVLVFIGFKMVVEPFLAISLETSLAIIGTILGVSILYSVLRRK